MSSDVAKSFEEHHSEIKRRANAKESSKKQGRFERVVTDAVDYPFKLEDQAYVLFSVSHVGMSPFAENASEPALRIYGAFATQEDCLSHARVVQKEDPSCNIQMAPTHTWTAMASSPERIADAASIARHIQAVLDSHTNSRGEATRDFEQNVERRTAATCDSKVRDAKEKRRKEAAEAEAANIRPRPGQPLSKAGQLPRAAEIRDQAFVVLSFLRDTQQTIPEPCFCVYACLATEADANAYVRNTAADHVENFDIDVCNMYEWLHPQNVDATKLRTEVFRQEELNNIIRNHKSQPAQVEAFKKWRDAPGEEGPSTEESVVDGAPQESLVDGSPGEGQLV